MAKTRTIPHVEICEDAIAYLKAVNKLGRRGWIYRGQMEPQCNECGAVSSRPFKSSLMRFLDSHKTFIKRSSWYPREENTLRRFKRAAHLHLRHLPGKSSELDWLALMQHYGAPTRMLDFTFNPAVALFFALENWIDNPHSVTVHALHANSIRKQTIDILGGTKERRSELLDFDIGEKPPATLPKVLRVYDGRLPSDRHLVQEGLFLVPSHIDLDLEKWLKGFHVTPRLEPFGSHWIEFQFPTERDKLRNIVKQVMNMGMGPEHLFPGLQGLGLGLKFAWLDVRKDFDTEPWS